jgi:hypothetical protein
MENMAASAVHEFDDSLIDLIGELDIETGTPNKQSE